MRALAHTKLATPQLRPSIILYIRPTHRDSPFYGTSRTAQLPQTRSQHQSAHDGLTGRPPVQNTRERNQPTAHLTPSSCASMMTDRRDRPRRRPPLRPGKSGEARHAPIARGCDELRPAAQLLRWALPTAAGSHGCCGAASR